ncbi:ABC-three component system protein [Cobetia sp. 1AS1]|uniref:ABC-three component system protein n=1 Tax=Cobetia sp. 1AS1 TaxID=3040016 RepID=UPI00244BB009|nr:ABC-three component system protein [Cobetia sp. 1AS1]MDH2295172.1 hypothetical protein [Cobetia sp. 1AS1]
MTDQKTKAPHTAISTWSGFVYQGKLALYHCIKTMSDNINEHHDFKLQLESQDDFAIFKGENCISLHQVKAYKKTSFSEYKSGIETQKKNAKDRCIDTAYFHTAREITKLPPNFTENYYPVKLYSYPLQPLEGVAESKNYCPLDEVNQYIELQLKYLIKKDDNLNSFKLHVVEKIRESLESIISNKVISVHHRIHNATQSQNSLVSDEFIPLCDLYSRIVVDDLSQFENDEYFLDKLKCDIGSYYQEYLESQDALSDKKIKKLDNYIAKILALDIKGMVDLLNITMPHRKGEFSNLRLYKDESFDSDSIKLAILNIFNHLIEVNVDESNTVSFTWASNDSYFYPTGIHTANEHSELICQSILRNALSRDVNMLFEGRTLITSAIDVEDISTIKFDGGAMESNEESYTENSISSYNNTCMISLRNVPRDLIDE